MKKLFIIAIACALSSPAVAQSFSDFLGKSMSNNAGTITINKNGTVRGSINGQDVRIKWKSEGGKFCREGKLGANNLPKKCQSIRIQGTKISFIDPDGTLSSSWTLD